MENTNVVKGHRIGLSVGNAITLLSIHLQGCLSKGRKKLYDLMKLFAVTEKFITSDTASRVRYKADLTLLLKHKVDPNEFFPEKASKLYGKRKQAVEVIICFNYRWRLHNFRTGFACEAFVSKFLTATAFELFSAVSLMRGIK